MPFLPSLPIRPSKGWSQPTILIVALRLAVWNKKWSPNSTRRHKNHLANSRFHTSPIHPLKWWSNPNPCTKTWNPLKNVQILRGAHHPIWTNIPRYSHNNTSVKINFFPYFFISNTLEVAPQSYHIRGYSDHNIAGVIIRALMHRIPSELHN